MKIVVASCSSYSDAWGPFISLFRKYWPNCEYDVVLVTDGGPYEKGLWTRIESTKDGKDYGWNENLANFIESDDSDIILLMQEDFFINAPVNVDLIKKGYNYIRRSLATTCLRLMPCPGPDYQLDGTFGIIDSNAAYRVSCQAALWEPDELARILRQTNCISDFEISGSKKSGNGIFLSVYRNHYPPLPYIVSAISRGKWNPDAIKLCQQEGIEIDTTRRPIDNPSN